MKLSEVLPNNGITKQVELDDSTFYDVTEFFFKRKPKQKTG